ncbi:MAG: hypothetical protein ACYC55_05730 [Candidatus Geothermincolia bacterium]
MTYLIESPHTVEQCARTMQEVGTKPELLEKMEFGCNSGVHDAWGFIEAGSENEARSMLPDELREGARVIEVRKLSPEEVKSLHEM